MENYCFCSVGWEEVMHSECEVITSDMQDIAGVVTQAEKQTCFTYLSKYPMHECMRIALYSAFMTRWKEKRVFQPQKRLKGFLQYGTFLPLLHASGGGAYPAAVVLWVTPWNRCLYQLWWLKERRHPAVDVREEHAAAASLQRCGRRSCGVQLTPLKARSHRCGLQESFPPWNGWFGPLESQSKASERPMRQCMYTHSRFCLL